MRQTRRELLRNLSIAGTVVAAPSFISPSSWTQIGSSDTLTKAALEADLETFGSDADPSFVIRYSDGEHDSLEDWATSGNRDLRRDMPALNMMEIRAPLGDIGVSEYGYGSASISRVSDGLQARDYIEFIDGNQTHELPEPVGDLGAESEWSPGLDTAQTFALQARARSTDITPDSGGLAFDEDAPEATLLEARNLSRMGQTVAGGVDTTSVTAEVIDTGVNAAPRYEDADGNSRIQPESTNFADDFDDLDDPTVGEEGLDIVADGNDHGDWVSACILSDYHDEAYRGPAPDADLLTAKSLDDDGGGSTGDIVGGIELAVAESVDILCMSLGSPQWSEAIADALEDAWNAGVFPVVAVGNDRVGTTFVASPASAADGFGVNATNVPESGDRDDTRIANFGNVGPHPGSQDLSDGASAGATPKLAAPGMNIRIDPIATLSGTSMAAPMVAGGATLLAAEGYTNTEIWDRLTACAYPAENFGITEAEYGLLDVEAALEGHEYEDDQEDVRNDAARTRDEFNELLAASRGSWLF